MPETPPLLGPVQAADWLGWLKDGVETALARALDLPDEERLDPRWARALDETRRFALRPGKRVRPALLLLGYTIGRGEPAIPEGLWRFAAGVELLHTFLLVHDDVADRAETRRGGPTLHRRLGAGRRGEDLAVVAGDHLFARAVEVMLAAGLRRAPEATRYYLGVCRETAAGQYLDLDLTGAPLEMVTLFQALRVALLKTARYGFVAPLLAGAILAGAEPTVQATLERVGRQLGLAFQLRDDLLGLFGDGQVAGKAGDADLRERKPTFPVLAAYQRAPAEARAELSGLWSEGAIDDAACDRARALVEAHGGRALTERAAARATAIARRALQDLPSARGMRALLDDLIVTLADRTA